MVARGAPRMKSRAFTLVELLVSLGIIAALAGLTFGATVTAKRNAHLSSNAVRLRQIGVALELYAQDHGAMPLRSLQVIADEKYLKDDRLLKSSLETYPEGYANQFDKCIGVGTIVGGPRVQSDFHPFIARSGAPSMYEHMKEWNDSPGLAVDFSIGKRVGTGCFYEYLGKYHRLQGDLSVVVRERRIRHFPLNSYGTDPRTVFIDELPDDQWGPILR
jgi:prepilin-type N-terminal cleavage/methylation domain-containing protein